MKEKCPRLTHIVLTEWNWVPFNTVLSKWNTGWGVQKMFGYKDVFVVKIC